MHLGNGIICPVTGIPMLIAAGAAAFFAYKKAKQEFSKEKILPAITLTGLVFSLQMINFSIPMTGSSGHIIGAVLLSILLGPYTAFLAMCTILLIQAVFFADGGLFALGCNIFNMGFLACFVAYPLFFKPLKNKPALGAILASVAALQMGSIAVVIEGASSIGNIIGFAGLMQTIHLAIGVIEGFVTALIITASKYLSTKKMSYIYGGLSIIFAGIISQYASSKPDGLEWSLLNVSDSVVMQTQEILYNIKLSVLTEVPFGNLAGLLIVCLIMYFICLTINKKCTVNLKD